MDFPQHSQHVLEQLNQQRQLGLLCDCTFVVDGVDFKAHKAVLAACSEYFKMLFVDQKDVVHLDISNAAGLGQVLEFMYTAKLSLSSENVDDVLAVASFLQMQDIITACHALKSLAEPAASPGETMEASALEGEKPYLCDKCGRGFNRVDNLRSHVKTVHQGKAGIKILEPEEGGEVSVVTVDDMVTLATEALAATAVTQLTGPADAPTVVPVGAAVTADETEVLKAEISKAVKQVQEEDPNTHILYACDSCGDKFLDANSLAQHVRIHTAQALVMFQTDADFYQQYGPGSTWPAGQVLQAGELVFRPRDGADGQPALAETPPTAPECPPSAE
ncbi:hypothetical protein E2I00_013703 [Balaenoptera physalus]|uniref:BTB domain-containing protein n=1 Tax=Balaenoptera physalus TaxID=9770 RepID=A0A6A1Q244_BALPH|nr:hypothetical protein E2I00_013703 [Balaenoptera physalus]